MISKYISKLLRLQLISLLLGIKYIYVEVICILYLHIYLLQNLITLKRDAFQSCFFGCNLPIWKFLYDETKVLLFLMRWIRLLATCLLSSQDTGLLFKGSSLRYNLDVLSRSNLSFSGVFNFSVEFSLFAPGVRTLSRSGAFEILDH